MDINADPSPLKSSSLQSVPPTDPSAMTADVEEKSPPKGGMKQLVACRIEGHKIQKRLSPKKKALDPLRYLPDGGGYYALFTIAAYFETEGDETTERRHVVQRSYKQICTLHSRLLKTYPKSNLPKDLPSMRNKRYDNEYIEEKRNELTKYLAQLMQIPEVKASNVLRDFLEASTAAEDSSDDEDGPVAPLRMLEGLPGTIITVRAGQSFSVTLPLSAAGDIASWQFTTKKHNIGFSATFGGEMIRAYSREGADVKPITGFYRCTTPGTCTLTWDNTYTWSKGKVLIYWAEVESHNEQNTQSHASATSQEGAVSTEKTEAAPTGSGSDAVDVDNRRLGFIEHTRSNSMHPRHLVNSSISLLSKPFVHGHGHDDGSAHGKSRRLIPGRTTSAPALSIPSYLQASERGPQMKSGSLIIQRSVKFRGRHWYRKWFVLDPRKCVLRYYDSEAAARRGLSLAKLNLTNKHASLAITSRLSLDAAPTPYMFLIRTKKHCWKICAPSQSEYNAWENAISTAILTAQLSRRGRKSKKAMVKAAKKSPLVRKDSHASESDDETPKSDMATDTNGNNEVATMGSSRDPDRPLSPIEESDDDDDDSDNKDDGDSDDDDESESDSDDELHEGDDIEVVPPMTDIDSPINSQDEAVGSLPDLQNLPLEWKLGLVAVFNVALLSVRSAPVVVIVLVLFIINWYLLLKYMKATKDNEMDSSTAKPKAE
ncbi:Pleckstrin homology domain-containing protein [Phytophthora infestans]|nr:Pleckstrin homology domain-containing protein [Phytophthora infestans]